MDRGCRLQLPLECFIHTRVIDSCYGTLEIFSAIIIFLPSVNIIPREFKNYYYYYYYYPNQLSYRNEVTIKSSTPVERVGKFLEFIVIFPEIFRNVRKFPPNIKFLENLQPYTAHWHTPSNDGEWQRCNNTGKVISLIPSRETVSKVKTCKQFSL